MSVQSEQFDRAAAAAGCHLLQNGGQALIGAGAWSLATGAPGLAAMGLGALGVFAANYAGCWDPDSEPTNPPIDIGSAGRCVEVEGGCGEIWLSYNGRPWETEGGCSVIRYLLTHKGRDENRPELQWYNRSGINCEGIPFSTDFTYSGILRAEVRPCEGATCKDKEPSPHPYIPPRSYTDPITKCDLTIEFKGWAELPGEELRATYKIAPAASSSRASGGVITNCNFPPVVIMPDPTGGGPGKPPPTIPWSYEWDDVDPFGGGQPPWMTIFTRILGGIAGGTTTYLLQQLFDPNENPETYELIAPCDFDKDGNPQKAIWDVPKQSRMTRLLAWQEAHLAFLQSHLYFKTPTCGSSNKPDLFLHWRSLTFESDDYTDVGNRRLVKRLRYRGASPGDLVELANHWKDFSWDTGGVIVFHKGSAVGTPKVWAASVDEGKRVLRHAFREAGIDPDQVGEWGTSSSDHPRYGVPRTVRLAQVDGCWMATARPGPDGPIQAALIHPHS